MTETIDVAVLHGTSGTCYRLGVETEKTSGTTTNPPRERPMMYKRDDSSKYTEDPTLDTDLIPIPGSSFIKHTAIYVIDLSHTLRNLKWYQSGLGSYVGKMKLMVQTCSQDLYHYSTGDESNLPSADAAGHGIDNMITVNSGVFLHPQESEIGPHQLLVKTQLIVLANAIAGMQGIIDPITLTYRYDMV